MKIMNIFVILLLTGLLSSCNETGEEVSTAATENEKEVMVIGGASLCEQLLPKVNRLYITRIDSEFEGDIYFPTYDASSWHQVSAESHSKDIANNYSYHFIVLERNS